ncbi:MAG: hypothetical protein ABIH59_03085 [archaeon]
MGKSFMRRINEYSGIVKATLYGIMSIPEFGIFGNKERNLLIGIVKVYNPRKPSGKNFRTKPNKNITDDL